MHMVGVTYYTSLFSCHQRPGSNNAKILTSAPLFAHMKQKPSKLPLPNHVEVKHLAAFASLPSLTTVTSCLIPSDLKKVGTAIFLIYTTV